MSKIDELIALAKAQDGYLEKASNAQLDDKTANAGRKNYTKYGREMGCNGNAWCDAFVDWCFVTLFGRELAKKILFGFSNYTPTSAAYYKKNHHWTSIPKVGFQIFFRNDERICHTGIVYKVTSTRVYTIEGNTSSASGVVANGGCVRLKSYKLTYNRIAGYGIPQYELVEPGYNPFAVPTYSLKKSRKKFLKKEYVMWLQYQLNKMGYGLEIDGSFGPATDAALRDAQKKLGLKVDGSCGPATRKALLED